LFLILVVIVLSEQFPPNRGDLTVAEFAENYNAMVDYHGIKTGKHLNAEGQWEDNPTYDRFFSAGPPLSEFSYTVHNDIVKGVRFTVSASGYEGWLGANSQWMSLAALAFVGAQKEAGIFSHTLRDTVETIQAHSHEDFAFRAAGIDIRCHLEYSHPAMDGEGVPSPEDGEEIYSCMIFTMEKA
jgi:hypothetical protein